MTTRDSVDLSKYIEIREDRPYIRKRRIPVDLLISQQRLNNLSVTEMAYNFTLSEAEVLAALLYYQEHKDHIELLITDEIAQFEEMKRQHGKD